MEVEKQEMKERRKQKKKAKEAERQRKIDLEEVEIMKKQEKYAGKTDEELLEVLKHERESAAMKIQMGFKNRGEVKK